MLSELIEALSIIVKYDPNTEFCVGHDQIWVGDWKTVNKLATVDEKKRLKELNWFEDADSYSRFV